MTVNSLIPSYLRWAGKLSITPVPLPLSRASLRATSDFRIGSDRTGQSQHSASTKIRSLMEPFRLKKKAASQAAIWTWHCGWCVTVLLDADSVISQWLVGTGIPIYSIDLESGLGTHFLSHLLGPVKTSCLTLITEYVSHCVCQLCSPRRDNILASDCNVHIIATFLTMKWYKQTCKNWSVRKKWLTIAFCLSIYHNATENSIFL